MPWQFPIENPRYSKMGKFRLHLLWQILFVSHRLAKLVFQIAKSQMFLFPYHVNPYYIKVKCKMHIIFLPWHFAFVTIRVANQFAMRKQNKKLSQCTNKVGTLQYCHAGREFFFHVSPSMLYKIHHVSIIKIYKYVLMYENSKKSLENFHVSISINA